MPKILTQDEVIKRFKKVHGNKYNYDAVFYTRMCDKVVIFCNECGQYFEQKPVYHLQGNGCTHCFKVYRKTKEQFIKEAKEIHGDKFNYDEVIYKNAKTKVKIFCNTCKQYNMQIPDNHLKGAGCAKCRGYNKPLKQLIKEFKNIHGDKYSYDSVEYVNVATKIKIFCNKCQKHFNQSPNAHLSGSGCPKCAGKNKTTEDVINEFKDIHGDKYSYDQVIYDKNYIKVKIFCNKCKKYFLQTPQTHLSGAGCPICNGGVKKTFYDVINDFKKVHGDKYNYDHVIYENNHTNIKIFCNECKKYFLQTPQTHLSGSGCIYCRQSPHEKMTTKILDKLNIEYDIEKKFDGFVSDSDMPYRYDFYLNEFNICLEIDGSHHFKNDKLSDLRDEMKNVYCDANNINLKRFKVFKDEDMEYVEKWLSKLKINGLKYGFGLGGYNG